MCISEFWDKIWVTCSDLNSKLCKGERLSPSKVIAPFPGPSLTEEINILNLLGSHSPASTRYGKSIALFLAILVNSSICEGPTGPEPESDGEFYRQ